MKNEGKKFEEDLNISISNSNVFIYRLKDTSSSWNNGQTGRFTSRNACDFISFNPILNKILMIECKSFKGKSISFSNIKTHQVEEMYFYKHKYKVDCYMFFNFRDLEETYALDIDFVREQYLSGARKSISLDFVRNNGFLIKSVRKRVRFTYFLEDFYKKA